MTNEEARLKILEMIDSGVISADEGLKLLSVMESSVSRPEVEADVYLSEDFDEVQETIADKTQTSSFQSELEGGNHISYPEDDQDKFGSSNQTYPDEIWDADKESFDAEEDDRSKPPPRLDEEELERWRRWWMIPLNVGVSVSIFAGLLMYWTWSSSGFGFWFFCLWVPFLLGVLMMAASWGSRKARWIHIRVQQAPGESPQNISISFPIPLRLTALALRIFGRFIPYIDSTGLDELIVVLGDSATPDTPLFVDVDEGEGEEKVQIYIG